MGKSPLSPDDDLDGERTFRARFNQLVDILLVESSVKLVARTAADVADLYSGAGVFLGDPRMARRTGLSERTVQTAWGVLRSLGMAERVEASRYDEQKRKRTADKYDLLIPPNWRNFPVLGPSEGRFRCLYCGKAFNPRAHNRYDDKTGDVSWIVTEFCFCPRPRRKDGKQAPSCFDCWGRARPAKGGSWSSQAWDRFREARGEEWPPRSMSAVA